MKRNDKTSGFQHTAFNIRSFDIQFRGMQLFLQGVCVLFVSSGLLCSNLDNEQSMGFVVSCHGREREYGTSTRTGRRGREEEEEEEEEGRRKEEEEGRKQEKDGKEEKRREKDDPSQSSTKYSPRQILQDLFQPGLFHPIFHDRDRPLIRRCCCSCHARF